MKPMLAKVGSKELFNKEGFIYEPKLDGTRAVCYYNNGKIKLINRRGRNITKRYPEFNFKKNIKADSCILDGEIVIYNDEGNPDFNLLQRREHIEKEIMIQLRSKQYPATYVVFDIIKLNNEDLTNKHLLKRKDILEKTVSDNDIIQKIFYTTRGESLWNVVRKRNIEGVIAKKKNSKYESDKRSSQWLKIKFLKTIDCIIIGYTQEKRIISALALGVYDKGKLRYVGRVGTGFTEKFLKELKEQLTKLEAKKPPVSYESSKDIKWVKPKLICEVKYLELTKDKQLRAPSFKSLRNDKPLKECILP